MQKPEDLNLICLKQLSVIEKKNCQKMGISIYTAKIKELIFQKKL